MNAEILYGILKAQIEGGQLPADSPLPSEAKLCADYRLARGTVRAALRRLDQEGYVRSGQGRKRTVRHPHPLRIAKLRIPPRGHSPRQAARGAPSFRTTSFGEYLRELGKHPTDVVLSSPAQVPCYRLTEARFEPAEQVREALRLEADSEVVWFLRLRLAGDDPVALQWSVIPAGLITLPERWDEYLIPGGLTALFHSHHIYRARVESSYTAARAVKQEATYLRLNLGAPLIEERRVSWFFDPAKDQYKPYEYLVSLYTDRVALAFDWEEDTQPAGGPGKGRPPRKRPEGKKG